MLNSNFSNTLFEADSVARGKARQFTDDELRVISARKSFGGPDDNRRIDNTFGRKWISLTKKEKEEVGAYFSQFGLK